MVFSQSLPVDLSLNNAIDLGLKNNPEIKSSRGNIDASRGRLWSAISPASPDISITHDYIPAGQNLNKFGEKTIGISQPVDFPTAYVLRGSKYALEKNIAEFEMAQVELEVVANVKRSYFTALALQEQVKFAQKNCALAEDFVKKSEVRYSVGEGTNLEKLTAKVNFTEAQNMLEVQQNRLIAAFAGLGAAMGRGKGEAITCRLTDTLEFIPCEVTLEQLLDDAMALNPALKAGKLRVDACTREKTLAWSSLLPTFNFSYYNKQAPLDEKNYYGAAVGMSVPLWFFLDHRGKIQEAEANISTAKARLLMAGNAINTKTLTVFAEFKHEEKQVQRYRNEALPQSEEIFRMAARSYEAGEITYLEFLQAEQTFINSRGNYINALLSYNLAIVAIEETIGKTIR